MAIENRDLAVGARLEAKYKKVRYVCTVEQDEEGKLAFILEDGKRFKSPSSAASAVMGGSAANGWRFWSLEGEVPAEPALSTSAPPTGNRSSRAKTPKLFKRLPSNGLEEGQHRLFCSACQKSFVTTETEPQVCPEGHRADDPELTSSVGISESEGAED